MFNKILIANRGEIACRIIRSAKKLGIATVAIYSTVDAKNPHVLLADEAYWVGEGPSIQSYLNIAAIIEVAKKAKVEAIHPGYGFLSENIAFAKACLEAAIIFIGPPISAIEAMASKQLSKQLLENTNIPLIPGYHGLNQEKEFLLQEAKKIGFPILLKPANGGGGKGMRIVNNQKEFSLALEATKREARASFGDDLIIMEKLIPQARHIEVQIMADNYGQIIHLFERDCSIQRRHQKIIEEAPALHVEGSLREKLTTAACEVARTIDYRGAGTVEFLLDPEDNFYFMEMNTRLQVEHPVSEMITGLDFVELQIKIAANVALAQKQNAISYHGHAIECRIYAEDPQTFLPSTGRINFLKEPQESNIRLDSGVMCAAVVSQYYDPMIAKLIVWGENRKEAISRMQYALNNYFISGIKTNLAFLQSICQNPKFIAGQISTSFLSEEKLDLAELDLSLSLAFACAIDYLKLQQQYSDPLSRDTFAWQFNATSQWIWRYQLKEQIIAIKISAIALDKFTWQILNNESKTLSTKETTLQILKFCPQSQEILLTNGDKTNKCYYNEDKDGLEIILPLFSLKIKYFTWQQDLEIALQSELKAPMPATIVAILKQKGDFVKAGESLIILEAMKMEHTILAPRDGILAELFYSVGSQVAEGSELAALEE